ncbi:unnamed protein product [Clonostachys chloroleuca]|uniref:F-box domain-containing protein n=1 Tax=Clonostachys chloroleuca TaxID=1926264 RepID=A0AA35LTB3_9HYPO|nr:unnamed protein product [Clonostachys chloroleuca]
MGYHEYHCLICSVSFAIARIRTLNEPPDASWGCYGITTRHDRYVEVNDLEHKEEDSEAGSDEEYEDELGGCGDGCMMAVWPREGTETHGGSSSDHPHSLHPTEEMYYRRVKNHPEEVRSDIWARLEGGNPVRLEHIAGPDCESESGYNGHHISVEEMRGCNTMQGLIVKDPDWEPEDGDEEFESSGRYYLTGLHDANTNLDSHDSCTPTRHGCSCVSPALDSDDSDKIMAKNAKLAYQYSVPVHPTCLEVLKRVHLRRYGRADVDKFLVWWELGVHKRALPQDPCRIDASHGRDQYWLHNSGAEYLAANPLFVPGLGRIFRLADTATLSESGKRINNVEHEVFAVLPTELRRMILDCLSRDEITKLHHASPFLYRNSMRDLGGSFMKEHPWLWEYWAELPYSSWALTTATELQESIESPVKQLTASRYIDWGSVMRMFWNGEQSGRLKGLQNRRRIWKICDMILNKVEEHHPLVS